MRRHLGIVLSTAIVWSGVLGAQGTESGPIRFEVRGRVTRCNLPSPATRVTLLGAESSFYFAVTDKQGQYSIEALPAGTYDVSVDDAPYDVLAVEDYEITHHEIVIGCPLPGSRFGYTRWIGE